MAYQSVTMHGVTTIHQTSRRWNAAFKLMKWLLVGVGFGLMPIGGRLTVAWANGQDASRSAILGGGELFLVSAALGAAAIGEILFDQVGLSVRFSQRPMVRFILASMGFFSLAISIWSAVAYSGFNPGNKPDTFITMSLFAIATSVVTTSTVIVLSELR
jgi:hypothetical protein